MPIVDRNNKTKLAIALGDPAGIGSEVVLKALAKPILRENAQITLFGSRSLLSAAYQYLSPICQKRGESLVNPEDVTVFDIPVEEGIEKQISFGKGNAASGAASFAYLQEAIAQTIKGDFQGIVTAPIAKSCWKAAGHNYPGQTEVLAESAGIDKFGMMFVARSPHTNWRLCTLLATTHIPLHQVPTALTPELMSLKLDLLVEFLKTSCGLQKPKIVISGLNPHSGEAGQLGTEEQDWLIPWLNQQRVKRPQVTLIGLVPPDTMWVKPGQAWYGNSQDSQIKVGDAYLALYHDQGLIPIKLIAFDRAINTTIGLPFIRTSPDHGTAFDIAGKGIADSTSMQEAIKLATELIASC
ncbi:MAG: 4-hydroxythreonine-4-phosphate dehydrogenase PdxA [Spirulinaceae cyanobacterium]